MEKEHQYQMRKSILILIFVLVVFGSIGFTVGEIYQNSTNNFNNKIATNVILQEKIESTNDDKEFDIHIDG